MIDLPELFGRKSLTKKEFVALKADEWPHRICYADTHKGALKPYRGKYAFKFSLPFYKGAAVVFEADTGIQLYPDRANNIGCWTGLHAEQQKLVADWMAAQGTRVYMRDLLNVSLCLGGNMDEDFKHTELGELERRAKYDRDPLAIEELGNRVVRTLTSSSVFKRLKVVSVIPPRQGKEFDLPTEIATYVGRTVGIPFVPCGSWTKEKGQPKQATADQKWDLLEDAGFRPNEAISEKEKILLIDDLYQSGATLNFVASKLMNELNADVTGLCIVKSRRDTDNS